VRVLFAFDLKREAILLVGGDKGGDWKGWYDENIPIADDRFDEHQAELAEQRSTEASKRNSARQRERR
jgi:hypothetical protein